MADAKLNSHPFTLALEPDGIGGHWFDVPAKLTLHDNSNVEVSVALDIIKQWPEPSLPVDIQTMLDTHQHARATWSDATPTAHWEWLRWIRSTNNPATRQKRIETAHSKLTKGMRRPCCFNRTQCTDPEVSTSGVLIGAKRTP